MDERKTIYLDDAMDEIARWIGYLDEDMIHRIQTGLKKLPSADPEAAIVKVLKMVEEYKEKTGTDEIIIMPKNGMKAWDENGVEYTMQPTCNNLATDTISRKAAIALAKDICVPTKDGTVYRHRCIDPDAIKELPSVQPEPISEAYAKAVRTWLVEYQVKCAELQGRYTPYEILGWVVSDWRKENEIW